MTVAARLAGSCMLLALAACADRGPEEAAGGTMVIGVSSAWTPGPPIVVGDAVSKVVSDQLFERLADIGPQLNIVGDVGFAPQLARRWEWSKDSLSIAFALDPQARWHDGRPVRASDVRFTLLLAKDPKTGSPNGALLANVDSISVRDSVTAVAWFHRRTPEQFFDLVYQLPIMPEHVWKDVPHDKLAQADAARAPIGSGRFRFAHYEPGVRLELVADTTNYNGRARLDRVIFSIAPDAGAAITQLLSGAVDFLEFVPADLVPRLDSSATLRPMPYPALQFAFIGFNARDSRRPTSPHPILGDVRVRRALSMALDRAAMLRNVFDTLGILGVGPYPTALADTAVKLLPFDRAHAAALLDSAGWKAGADGIRRRGATRLALSVIVPASSRSRMRYSVLLQEQWKTIGVDATLESMEFTAFRDRQAAGRFDVTMGATGYDPSLTSLKQAWASAGIGPTGLNVLAYSNHTFDTLLDSAMMAFDPVVAKRYARRAVQQLVDDAPAVWAFDNLTLAGIHRRLRPEGLRADGWWVRLADWWIPENERIERDRIGLRPASP